jgi:hypothetical protein
VTFTRGVTAMDRTPRAIKTELLEELLKNVQRPEE